MKRKLVWISVLLVAALCMASCSGTTTGKVTDKNDKSEIEEDEDEDDVDDGDYDEDDIIAWKSDKAEASIDILKELAGEKMFRELTLGPLTNDTVNGYIDDIAAAEITGDVYVVNMSEEQLDYFRTKLNKDADGMSDVGYAVATKNAYSLITNTISSRVGAEPFAVASMFLTTDYWACDMVFENEAWIYETDTEGIGFCVYFNNGGEGVVGVTGATFVYGDDSIDECFESTLSYLGMTYEMLDADVDSDYTASAKKLKSYSDDEILEWKTEAAKKAFDDVLTLTNDNTFIKISDIESYVSELGFNFEDINPYGTVYVIDSSKEAMKEYTLKSIIEDGTSDPALLTNSVVDYLYRRSTTLVNNLVSSRENIAYVLVGTTFTTTDSYSTKMDFESETWIIESDTEGFGICVNFMNAGDGVIVVTGTPCFANNIAAQLDYVNMDYDVIEVDFD